VLFCAINSRAIVRLEGFGQPKGPMTSTGMGFSMLRLVAQFLNQLRYRVPYVISGIKHNYTVIISKYRNKKKYIQNPDQKESVCRSDQFV
jgi:hypothetical protein